MPLMVLESVLSSSSLRSVGKRCLRSPWMMADTVCRMLCTRAIKTRRVIRPIRSPAMEIKIVFAPIGRQAVLEIAMDDGGYGLPHAMHASHQDASRDQADQEPGDGDHRDGGDESVPEAALERREQLVVATHEEHEIAELGHVHERGLNAVLGQVHLDPVIARSGR